MPTLMAGRLYPSIEITDAEAVWVAAARASAPDGERQWYTAYDTAEQDRLIGMVLNARRAIKEHVASAELSFTPKEHP